MALVTGGLKSGSFHWETINIVLLKSGMEGFLLENNNSNNFNQEYYDYEAELLFLMQSTVGLSV